MLHGIQVIVCTGERIVANASGYPGHGLYIKCCHAAAGLHQEGVCMPMIAAFKFYEFITASVTSCQTQGAHAGFGATAHHSYQIHIADHTFYKLRHVNLQFSRGTVRGRVGSPFLYRLHNRLVSMAQYHGPPGGDKIYVLVIICII